MDEARLLDVVFKVVVGIFPIEEVAFSAYTLSLIVGVFFLLVDGSCMVSGDTGGLGDRGIGGEIGRLLPIPIRGQERTWDWSDGSWFSSGAVRFNRVVSEGEGRSECCGDELRRGLVCGGVVVAFEFLNWGGKKTRVSLSTGETYLGSNKLNFRVLQNPRRFTFSGPRPTGRRMKRLELLDNH